MALGFGPEQLAGGAWRHRNNWGRWRPFESLSCPEERVDMSPSSPQSSCSGRKEGPNWFQTQAQLRAELQVSVCSGASLSSL